MPWKVRQVVLSRDGTIYAPKGTILPDDDPIALANPTKVVAVKAADDIDIVVHDVEVQTEPPPVEDEPEELEPPEEDDTPDFIV